MDHRRKLFVDFNAVRDSHRLNDKLQLQAMTDMGDWTDYIIVMEVCLRH